MDLTPAQESLFQIYYPHAFERQKIVRKNGTRFVHYTHADAAMKILETKTVWMRMTSCMSDFMEVEHGLDCLIKAYKKEAGNKLKSVINKIFPNVSQDIELLFNDIHDRIRFNTYITCFSEHSDTEDNFGRLSMWRAFSETTGVALVLNNSPFLNPTDALKAYASPVAYLSNDGFSMEVLKLADNIESNVDLIRAEGRESMINHILLAFKYATICTKHPGFEEEKEWRITYTPYMSGSPHLEKSIEIIKGIPQTIHKIHLKDIPEENFIGVEIPKLLDRLIIGPTAYSLAMRDAFETLLADVGVDDPADRIHISDIPIRV